MSTDQLESEFVTCREERFKRYLERDVIQQRIRELGSRISRDFEGRRPVLIGVLNGAFMFLADLMKAITIECEVDFIKLSSYGAEKISSGVVSELKGIDADLSDRHVIIVEDIVDTGLSLQYLLERVQAHGPASVRSAVLLHKPDATRVDVPIDYLGFRIPDLFVIGYGLDYGQLGRNLPDIYVREAGRDVPES